MPSNNYDAKAPNPVSGGLLELFKTVLKQESRNIHTCIPAKVTDVDYDKCLVKVQPLIKMMRDPETLIEVTPPEVDTVPIIFTSAKRGKARISVPVTIGDVGLLLYAERETENFLTSDGVSIQESGVYESVGYGGNLPQIGFLPEVFAPSAARKFLKDTLVVEFSKAISWWKANGQMTHKNDNCSLVMEATGEKTFTNLVATDTITATGDHTFTNGVGTVSTTSTGIHTYTNANSTTTVATDGTLTFQNNGCNITASSAGAVNVVASGAVGVEATGAVNIAAGGAVALVGGAGATITSGSVEMAATTAGALSITAPTSITLTVGSSSITITSSGVVITGPTESSSVN